jgi:hypothetical protein
MVDVNQADPREFLSRSALLSSGNFLKHRGTEDTECFIHALISLLTPCLCVLIKNVTSQSVSEERLSLTLCTYKSKRKTSCIPNKFHKMYSHIMRASNDTSVEPRKTRGASSPLRMSFVRRLSY